MNYRDLLFQQRLASIATRTTSSSYHAATVERMRLRKPKRKKNDEELISSTKTTRKVRRVEIDPAMTGYEILTDEQNAFVKCSAALHPNCNIVMRAYAGSGKTKSITAFIRQRPTTSFLYLVFNKSMAGGADLALNDVQNATVRTFHALAHDYCTSGLGMSFADDDQCFVAAVRQYVDQHKPSEVARLPKLQDVIGIHVMKGLSRFCQSSEVQFHEKHLHDMKSVTYLPGVFVPPIRIVLEWCKAVWKWVEEMKLPVTFDLSLKVMHLKCEQLASDFQVCMMDEAQDIFPVVMAIIQKQQWARVLVGDELQQINRWNGAKNAMNILSYEAEYFLTKCFRFDDAWAKYNNFIISLARRLDIPMHGAASYETHVHPVNTELKRTFLPKTEGSTTQPLVLNSETEDEPLDSESDDEITVPVFQLRLSNSSSDGEEEERCVYSQVLVKILTSLNHPEVALVGRTNASLLTVALNLLPLDRSHNIHLEYATAFYSYLKQLRDLCDLDVDEMLQARNDAKSKQDFDKLKRIDWVEGATELNRSKVQKLASLPEIQEYMPQENKKVAVLTTAHGSKGLEWDRVVIHDDLEVAYFQALDSRREEVARLTTTSEVDTWVQKYMKHRDRDCEVKIDNVFLTYVALTRVRREIWLPDSFYKLHVTTQANAHLLIT